MAASRLYPNNCSFFATLVFMANAESGLSLAACGSKDTTEQDAYRQYGINCLESGNYEDAIKAFQNALNQAQN